MTKYYIFDFVGESPRG